MKMTTDIPSAITTPDTVESRLGTLKFFDGLPDRETTQKVYDNLDFSRAVAAFLNTMPAVGLNATRKGFLTFGPANLTVVIFESLLDSKSLVLTANSETVYTLVWLDSKNGPLVIEVPPNVHACLAHYSRRHVWNRSITQRCTMSRGTRASLWARKHRSSNARSGQFESDFNCSRTPASSHSSISRSTESSLHATSCGCESATFAKAGALPRAPSSCSERHRGLSSSRSLAH